MMVKTTMKTIQKQQQQQQQQQRRRMLSLCTFLLLFVCTTNCVDAFVSETTITTTRSVPSIGINNKNNKFNKIGHSPFLFPSTIHHQKQQQQQQQQFRSSLLPLYQSSIPFNNNNDDTQSSTTGAKDSIRHSMKNNNNNTKKITMTTASDWHRQRRREMISKYGDQIKILERDNSQQIGLPLLVLSCTSLWMLSIYSSTLPLWAVISLAIFPGSMFSLWQLQLLHDVIHGSMLQKKNSNTSSLQDSILFWGSMPSVFGYYLYLKAGHLSHHKNMGQHSLAELFESPKNEFEDGDVLFVAHRMKLKGDIGPKFPIPFSNLFDNNNNNNDNNKLSSPPKTFKMSISKSAFHFWKDGNTVANALLFITSFLFERYMLVINDVFVAILGKNLFFPNKPSMESFQKDCVQYARVSTAIRLFLWSVFGWKSLLFLYLSESLWSLPPHPACAMFVTNHGSDMITNDDNDNDGDCVPTRSTYAGPLYSIFTLGTNYHTEHHDFPTIPFHQLYKLRSIAPEYYRTGSDDNVFQIMKETFQNPSFYACMDAGSIAKTTMNNK